MKTQHWALVIAAASLLFAGWCKWQQNQMQERVDWLSGVLRAQQDAGTDIVGSAGDDRLAKIEAATPGLGEIMSGIQVHAAKLYYAGQARNWPLAEFEAGEIEEALAAVPVVRPKDNEVPLGAVIEAFKNSQWAALKDALARQDLTAFNKSYGDMVTICNACHQATGRPFIVMTVPTAPPVPNQQWAPPAEPAGN